jgi:hypothetical protein
MAPAVMTVTPEPGPGSEDFMATHSVPKDTTRSEARKRMLTILKEAEERYRRELMDEEERGLLHDRIVRLKIRLAKTQTYA